MGPAPHKTNETGRIALWHFFDESTWPAHRLAPAIAHFLAQAPSAEAVHERWERVQAEKRAPGLSEAQQVALAAAGLELAGYAPTTGGKPADVFARTVRAARQACQAVHTPETLRLWARPELRERAAQLVGAAFTQADALKESVLRADARVASDLLDVVEAAATHLPELGEPAGRLRARLAPVVEAAQRAFRQSKRCRHFGATLDQILEAGAADALTLAGHVEQLVEALAAEPHLLAERAEKLAQAMDVLRYRFGPEESSRPPARLTDAAGRLATTVADGLADLFKAHRRLILLHRATLLAWVTHRARGAEGKHELARIAGLAFDTAVRRVAPDSAPAKFKGAGEIAAVYLHTVAGERRFLAAAAGCNWFRAACPGGFGDLAPTDLPGRLAWLECLEAARQFTEAEKALRAWLALPDCPPAAARKFLLRLADLKLAQIAALGGDALPSEANGVKSLLRKVAAQSSPAADPVAGPVTAPADAALHWRLAQLHASLGEWADAERQARHGLGVLPALPHDWPRRRARAQVLEWLGRALAAQQRWPDAEAAYREALAENWTPAAFLGRLHTLRESGAPDAWAEALASDPPRRHLGDGEQPVLAHIVESLQNSADLRRAVLVRVDVWFARHFLADLLRRGLTPDHALVAELRPELRDYRRGVSLETRLLAQQLASWSYQDSANPAEAAGELEAALARLPPGTHFARDLATHVQTALVTTAQAVQREYVRDALAAADPGALDRVLAGERWQTQTPSGYKHLDGFDLVARLQRWLGELRTELGARAGNWKIGEVEGAPLWVRGAAWFAVRAELQRLLGPGAWENFLGAVASGGALALRVHDRELVLQVKLNAPAAAELRPRWNEAVARWMQSAAEGRRPEASWDADFAGWKLTLKLAGSATREESSLLRGSEAWLDEWLAGERPEPEALRDAATAWLAATPRRELEAHLSKLLRWAHDYATMRTRLWLLEEGAAETGRHPRLLLERGRAAGVEAGAIAVVLRRFLAGGTGEASVLDFTTTVRETVGQRRAKAGALRYRLELEPGCLVRLPVEVAEFALPALCASAEKAARAAATNAEISVRLWTEGRLVRLEIAHPGVKKSETATGETGSGAETLAWFAQLQHGEFATLATQRHAQATWTLPLAFAAEEPTAAET